MSETNDLSRKVMAASAWLVGAKVIFACLSFVSVIALARLLDPEDFGLAAICTVVTALIYGLATVPVGAALIKTPEVTEQHFHSAWTINLLRSFILSSVVALLANLIAEYYQDERVTNILYFFAISMFISGLGSPKFILFEKNLDLTKQFWSSNISKFISVITAIGVAYFGGKYWALILGGTVGQFVAMLVSYYFAPYLPKISFSKTKELLSFSIWLTFSQLVNQLNYKADEILLGKFLNIATLGIYNMGSSLASLPTKEITQPLVRSIYPALAKINQDASRLVNAFKQSQMFILCLTLPVGVGFSYFSQSIILHLVGEKWLDAALIITILAPVIAVQSIFACADALAMSRGKTSYIFYRNVILLIMRIPLMVFALMKFGLVGLLVARVFTGVLGMLFNAVMVKMLVQLSLFEQVKSNGRYIISSLAMLVAIHFYSLAIIGNSGELYLSVFHLILGIFLGAAVYISCVFGLWAIDRKSGPEEKALALLNVFVRKWLK